MPQDEIIRELARLVFRHRATLSSRWGGEDNSSEIARLTALWIDQRAAQYLASAARDGRTIDITTARARADVEFNVRDSFR